MSAYPDSKIAKRILVLMRQVPPEVWPIIREFIWRRTTQQFNLLSDFITAELSGLADEERDDTLRCILQAIESADYDMLTPENTFQGAQPPPR
jgi:hypothetical protein